MVTTPITNLSKWDQKIKVTAAEEYESFRNVLDWTEGFGLVFVQCYPVQGGELIEQIKRDLPNKQVEILRFQEREEIRNLYDLVEHLPNREQIDILFIQGLENSFVPYIKSGYGGQGDYYKLDNLPPILGHLNLQRERFKRDFEICFVFLLPFFGVKYFIQRAPDFFDWRLGLFSVPGKKNLIELETDRLIGDADYDQYCQWNFSQRMTRILEIETLLNEDLEPEDKSSLLLEQGNLWVASSAYQEAISSYDNALKLKPDGPKAWNNRGIALDYLGRYEEAISSYDQALEIKPDYHQAWNNRGIALRNLGRLEEAITSYDEALKSKPNEQEAWYNRGNALDYLGRYEEALKSYEEALKSYNDGLNIKEYQNILFDKATVLGKLNRLEEANQLFGKVLKFNPQDPDVWYNKGKALKMLKKYEEALLSYDHVLEITPNDYAAIYHKATLYSFQKNTTLAIEYLKQAIELKPELLKLAKTDTDFDKIRNDSRFINLLNAELPQHPKDSKPLV